MFSRMMCGFAARLWPSAANCAVTTQKPVPDGGPCYVPTSQHVVDAMPGIAGVTDRDWLLRQLRPGMHIVFHDFDFGAWKSERAVSLEPDEKYDVTGNWSSTVHLWTVPPRAAQ